MFPVSCRPSPSPAPRDSPSAPAPAPPGTWKPCRRAASCWWGPAHRSPGHVSADRARVDRTRGQDTRHSQPGVDSVNAKLQLCWCLNRRLQLSYRCHKFFVVGAGVTFLPRCRCGQAVRHLVDYRNYRSDMASTHKINKFYVTSKEYFVTLLMKWWLAP